MAQNYDMNFLCKAERSENLLFKDVQLSTSHNILLGIRRDWVPTAWSTGIKSVLPGHQPTASNKINHYYNQFAV
jgi:hypothetical protein